MNISVLTPDKEIFQGPITSVRVPGTNGEFQILKNHAPIVSSLEAGRVQITAGSGEYRYFDEETGRVETNTQPGRDITFTINGGFIEVLDDEVSLLVTGVV